jgi:hypothetical protein
MIKRYKFGSIKTTLAAEAILAEVKYYLKRRQ